MLASRTQALPLSRRGLLRAVALTLAAVEVARHAATASEAGLRILCSGPAGSIPDLVARAVALQLPTASGRRALVDNRPGAAGRLSVAALRAAPADGSTLLLAQGAIATVYPYLYDKPGYDAAADLQPVSLASEMVLGLAVGPAVPVDVTTLADFSSWLRRNPQRAHIGSPGVGTLPHLLATMWFRKEALGWQHVAYSGGPPAVIHLLGGQISALVLPEGLLRQHHATGRVRVLASSGQTRSAYLPDVPTFVEGGHPELVVTEWFAFFASGRVPRSTVEAISAVLREVLASPALMATFVQAGMTPASSLPAALLARIAEEQRYWQTVLRANNINAD
ncbi:MAG: twin-arginine translocation pathway signal protein [Comamonadaceae bacterium]|nr:twin-arginine translocation pathway signal protein [Comamonadaceae bacterium]